jgi:hypothetical protein
MMVLDSSMARVVLAAWEKSRDVTARHSSLQQQQCYKKKG